MTRRTIVTEDAVRAALWTVSPARPVEGPFVRYEIRVEGHLSETLANAFPELEHVVMSGQTVLFGRIVDEAHLYGLLTRCQSLGLRVLEMRQLPE